jgi:putative heme-binding domain-containing protein
MRAFAVIVPILAAAALLLAQAPEGDVARGKAIFEGKGGCQSCHRIGATGSTYGPDLSEIGTPRQPANLEKSLLDPDAEIATNQRTYRVVTKAGAAVVGRLVNLDTFTVQLFLPQEKYQTFEKSDLREFGFVEKSPMPSFKGRLSPQEVADVVAYLSSLKAPPGSGRGRGRGPAPPAPAAH